MGQDCKYCGAYIASSADKCPACGKRINYKADSGSSYSGGAAQAYAYAEPEKEREKTGARTGPETYSYTYNNKARENSSNEAQSAQRSASPGSDAKENQLISFLCYFGILFLIPYLLKQDSDFVKFHSNQGLVLLIAGTVISFISDFVPLVGWLVGLAGGIFVFACFLKGLINVYHLQKKELPVIGSIRLLK